MAATGGGKIRTRRYHIASKPYAKGKQQPGLISRVTDTVKSIVPSWLQKYFNNGEIDEGRVAKVEMEQNNVTSPPNGSDEAAPIPDGRRSPVPSTSNAEPSTSRASLNFHDALSRPPLNRSHLHFPSQDASPALRSSGSLFSQPSTSTAPFPESPFAIASNFSLVKEIKDSSSQHEDDNISTTSGFSSRASDKDVPTSKTAPLLWSPETERTNSGSQTTHAIRKKPAFNLSVFGTSSLSAINNSVLSTSQLGDSPFYPGKTTYGGAAAAARTARGQSGTPYQVPVRRQVKAKPAGSKPYGVTSATARRILQSLERMSSPLADARRIPSVSSPLSTSVNHTDESVPEMSPKKRKVHPAGPPVQKLVTPVAAAVTGNRSMVFRPSLTPGAVSRTVEKSNKEAPVRCLPQTSNVKPAPPASTSSPSYPLSSTPTASSSGSFKMKRERSVRASSHKPRDEVVEVPDLPSVSLPISTLPNITFSVLPPTSTLSPGTTSVTSVPAQPTINKEDSTTEPFTFSKPIVKATDATPSSFSPASEYTFSAPKMKTASSTLHRKSSPALQDLKEASESQDDFDGPFKPAKVLKQGSVLDILKGPGFSSPAQSPPVSERPLLMASTNLSSTSTPVSGFGEKLKPATGLWNSDTCLLQKKAEDEVCLASTSLHPNTDSSLKSDSKPAKAPAASLASLFAPSAGSWECDTCLVLNKPDVVKCVACDTAKPGTGVKPTLTLPPVSKPPSALCTSAVSSATTTTSTTTTSGLLGFGDKFKKPEGAWDCDVCMVQNKAQDVKCVACQSPKPGTPAPLLGFGDKFKKPEGSWECDTCCVQNKAVDQQCVACQTAKPGTKAEPKAAAATPSSQTPVSKPATTAPLLGFGDKFKKPEGSWECDTCFIQNKAEDQQCVACQGAKPGTKAEPKGNQTSSTESGSSAFKFGTNVNSTSGGLKFGGSFSDNSPFKFGATSGSADFQFGGSTSDSSSGGIKFGGALTEPISTDAGFTGGFKFAAASTTSANEDKKSEPPNPGPAFKFGASGGTNFGSGAPNTGTTSASGGFTFGGLKSEEKEASVPSFNFSAEKAGASSTKAVSTTATAASITVPVFGKPPVTEPAPSAPSFATTAANVPALATSTFTFGKPEEKKDTSMPTAGFAFNAVKEAEKPAPSLSFAFGKPDPPKEVPKPVFAFGKAPEPAEAPKPAFPFGQNTADTSAPKLSFGFTPNATSAPASSSNIFGTPSNTTQAPTSASTSTFIFGQSSSSDATSARPLFGQQQDNQPALAAPTAAPAAAAPAAPQPFLFNAATNSATSTFSFGAAAATAPASAAPAPSAAPSPFVFTSTTSSSAFGSGQAPVFGQGSSQIGAPAFGSAAPSFSATPSPAPTFGGKPNAAPMFGQQPNATPAFGSSAASTGQGGFQFGGASGFGSSGSNSGVFTFGSGAAANSAPSPGMSTQPAAPGGGFNLPQNPTFNIGSSKSSFSSTPTGQHPIAGRRIKTAVRRRK